MRPHSLILAIAIMPAPLALAAAQRIQPTGVTSAGSARQAALGGRPINAYRVGEMDLAVGCDDSGFHATEGRKELGNKLLWGGGIVASLGAFALSSSQSSAAGAPVVLGGIVAMVAGVHMKSGADDPIAMDKAVQSLTIGSTTTGEVRACLGKPMSLTTHNSTDEVWTYNVTKMEDTGGFLGALLPIPRKSSTEMRSVTLTFKKGVLSDISKTATGF